MQSIANIERKYQELEIPIWICWDLLILYKVIKPHF